MNDTEALGDEICTLSAHLNAATCRLLALIAAFDDADGWAFEGCRSCAHWLNWKCGVGLNAAREKVRVAQALKTLPRIHDAFSKGALSYSKVRAMTRVATEDNEGYLLMIAEHGTAAHVETVVRGYRQARSEVALEEANERHARRELFWRYDNDGSVVLTARLDPEQGARLIEALEQRRHELAQARGSEDGVTGQTPFAALRADALMDLVTTGTDTEVVVHVSAETLREDEDCGRLAHGPDLAAETVRRLACDAGVVRLIEDARGQPLDVGRKTRSIPPALKRALKARDQSCRFPGCTVTRHVEGHHIDHWANGGETALHNLVSLCGHHHRLVHEGGFEVERLGETAFRFRRPDGTVIARYTLPPPVGGCPERCLRESNARYGISIDETTGRSKWDGWSMDAAMAVEGLLAASGELRK